MKLRVAEWILSLVMPPDRAASAVGDWMEDPSKRGLVWFWSCVFRAVAARIWSDQAASPGLIVTLALGSWVYANCLTLLTLVTLWLLAVLAAPVTKAFPGPVQDFTRGMAFEGCLVACAFQTGRWIARRAPGQEMTACIAAPIVQAVFISFLRFAIVHIRGGDLARLVSTNQAHTVEPSGSIYNVIVLLSLFAGAFWVRRKSLRSLAR